MLCKNRPPTSTTWSDGLAKHSHSRYRWPDPTIFSNQHRRHLVRLNGQHAPSDLRTGCKQNRPDPRNGQSEDSAGTTATDRGCQRSVSVRLKRLLAPTAICTEARAGSNSHAAFVQSLQLPQSLCLCSKITALKLLYMLSGLDQSLRYPIYDLLLWYSGLYLSRD